MQKCILCKSENMGAEVFEFRYMEDTEKQYVVIYLLGRERYFLACHVSHIIPIRDSECEQKWGGLYANSSFFSRNRETWENN